MIIIFTRYLFSAPLSIILCSAIDYSPLRYRLFSAPLSKVHWTFFILDFLHVYQNIELTWIIRSPLNRNIPRPSKSTTGALLPFPKGEAAASQYSTYQLVIFMQNILTWGWLYRSPLNRLNLAAPASLRGLVPWPWHPFHPPKRVGDVSDKIFTAASNNSFIWNENCRELNANFRKLLLNNELIHDNLRAIHGNSR